VKSKPPGYEENPWRSVASDSDGSHLIAGGNTGNLYTSSDYGYNWVERKPLGEGHWRWSNVASDSDGSHLIVTYRHRLYTLINEEINLDETNPSWCGEGFGCMTDSEGLGLETGSDVCEKTGLVCSGVQYDCCTFSKEGCNFENLNWVDSEETTCSYMPANLVEGGDCLWRAACLEESVCVKDEDCSEGMVCNENSVCVAKLGLGATCGANKFCLSGFCDEAVNQCADVVLVGANSGINLDLDGNGNLDASDIGWLKNNINDFWETILNKDPKKLHLFIKDLVAHFNN